MTAVVTDSAASLPRELASELRIEVVPLYLTFGDEVYRDGVDVVDLYARMEREAEPAGTSAPSPGDFLAAFERTGAEEIVCVTVASSVSGTHRAAGVAAQSFGGRVEVVDSGSASMGQGFVAVEAARAARDGGSLDEAVGRAAAVAERVRLVATIDTFDYLRKSGRVSWLAAYAGTKLRIKPVFGLARGEIRAVARPRTRSRALDRLVRETLDGAAGRPIHVAVVHAEAEEEAREVLERVRKEAEVVEEHVAAFTSAMGVHTGPGVVGLVHFPD